jgi:hypothetical protein
MRAFWKLLRRSAEIAGVAGRSGVGNETVDEASRTKRPF